MRSGFTGLLNMVELDQKLAGSLGLELARAEIGLTVNEYVALRFGGALGGLFIGAVVLRNLLLGLLLAVVALQAPVISLHLRSRQRQHRFQAQLPDIIMMLASGLRGRHWPGPGHGGGAARNAAPRRRGGRPRRARGRTGVSLADALCALGERMPGDDLAMLITAINIQAEVGGNLATVLESIVTTIRERVRIMQEIRTLTSMQRAGRAIFSPGCHSWSPDSS